MIDSLAQIINSWLTGSPPTPLQWQQLAAEELAAPLRAQAFGIAADNALEVVKERSHLLLAFWTALTPPRPPLLSPPLAPITCQLLWHLWLPLAIELAQRRQQQQRPLIQGILGVQGTGKTTLAGILKLILAHLGWRVLSLSLDDLYKTYSDRQRLRELDPRLIWRGPPGTHDIDLGIAVLDQLRQPQPSGAIAVPRFDKSAWQGAGDRTAPELVAGADIVLFEGWFVGVRPIDPQQFDRPPAPICTAADRQFARDINEKLQDYLNLWEKLDRLLILYPVDYRLSQAWRLQAERQAIAAGKAGMNDEQVHQFVTYFWRSLHPELFVKPLIRQPQFTDLTIEVNPDRSLGAIYRPQDLSPAPLAGKLPDNK